MDVTDPFSPILSFSVSLCNTRPHHQERGPHLLLLSWPSPRCLALFKHTVIKWLVPEMKKVSFQLKSKQIIYSMSTAIVPNIHYTFERLHH